MFTNALITGGTFTHVDNHYSKPKDGFERLQEAVAPGAFHNSGERFDPPKCLPNTRVAVLKRLMDWILRQDRRTQSALMMWLYGPAGAGKSAIAQTFAEMCHAENRLLASFFFSRNDTLRRTIQALVSTIAYQLCLNLPKQVYHLVVSAIEHDPLIFSRSLEAQLVALVVEPVKQLSASGFFNDPKAPRLIIIDGLDECEGSKHQINVLRTIFQLLQQNELPLLFLIASRPMSEISRVFETSSVISISARLALDSGYRSLEDLRRFFENELEEIKVAHPIAAYIPASWPGEDILEQLVMRSSGQFIYASTVMKFVGARRRRPMEQLDIILGISPATKDAPFAELDALYAEVFSRVEDISRSLQVIGLLILQPPLSSILMINTPSYFDLEHYLFLEPGDKHLILDDLRSLISDSSSIGPVILHASLEDFLFDQSRSKDLYINVPEKHTEYALLGFRHIFNDVDTEEDEDVFQSESFLILQRLLHHCAHAKLTPEIQKNVASFSLEFFLSFIRAKFGQHAIPDWLPGYFKSIASLERDTDQQFHKAQLKALDIFFLQHLEKYYMNPFLLLALAGYQNLDYLDQKPYFSPIFPKTLQAIDDNALCLRFLSSLSDNQEYQKLLICLLDDPVRSSTFFLDGSKFTDASITALTYLSNHWSHPIPAVRSDLDRYIRRNSPRRWREKYGRHSVLQSAMSRMKCAFSKDIYQHVIQSRPRQWSDNSDLKTYRNTCKYPYKKARYGRGVFRFVLSLLPYVLERAGRSKILINLARQFRFGPRAKTCRKSARIGKKAIWAFLTRFSEKPISSNTMDGDEVLQ